MARTDQDHRFMRLALAIGRRAAGKTWPNPAVGCVIVQSGRIIGRGHTQPGGRPHAERVALEQAGLHARGATAYVTLEPCAHHGKTSPCAQALIDAGIARVVAATSDPDPRVDGNGFNMLRQAGIEVVTGLCEDDARHDLSGFIRRITQSRPALTLKFASSVDGKIATSNGTSQWITGPNARRHVHMMRARHDAILVGSGTVRTDDPMLNLRNIGIDIQPIRVVIASDLNIPPTCKLLTTAREFPLWICHARDVNAEKAALFSQADARLVAVKRNAHHLDLSDVLTSLAQAGLTKVYCEGGAELAGSLLKQDLVDELHTYHAGFAMGGDGLSSIGKIGRTDLTILQRFELIHSQQIGPDIFNQWRRLR